MNNWWGRPKYWEKTCSSVGLSATNPTLSEPGSNPVCLGGKPVTNLLSYGTDWQKWVQDDHFWGKMWLEHTAAICELTAIGSSISQKVTSSVVHVWANVTSLVGDTCQLGGFKKNRRSIPSVRASPTAVWASHIWATCR
jgi:hypothetical protein